MNLSSFSPPTYIFIFKAKINKDNYVGQEKKKRKETSAWNKMSINRFTVHVHPFERVLSTQATWERVKYRQC